ncbi:MAG TPA: ABC transporter ATP-binding protein, partial [Candidatus Limnocylindria bacterium]|nr:ABC transporter ATP-binding protein [Candidatus Limnocylindria bacterium]
AVALVRRLRERGLTIVLVEHVLEVVMPLAETVIVLQQGRKIAEGPPHQLARDPAVIAAYLGPRFAHG